jgi:GMP synthase-like glutamine amidotransferase
METFKDLDLVYLKNNEFNIYLNAHIVFFSKKENEEKIDLLLMTKNENQEYSHLTTKVLPEDNSPIFSIARILTNEVTIFNEENFTKIKNGEDLTKEDLEKSKILYYFQLWEQKDFFYWLEKLSDDVPVIQYDLIQSHIFYFLEIPKIDTSKLNENLKNINCNYSFSYFSCDKLNNINSNFNYNLTINQTAVILYEAINVQNHINETLQRIKSNTFDMFYILSIKSSDGTKMDQAGFFHFPALFKGLYRKNTENWHYLICSKKLPDEKELKNAKAIIIPGSHLSINDDYEFLRITEKWIKDFHNNHPNVKYLGICFGMQIFMTSLGGKVEKMKTPFEVGPKKIELSDNFWNLNFVKKANLNKTESLNLFQAHGDECTIIPAEGKLTHYGKSTNCHNEIMCCEDERILLIQGHPEYLPLFNIERMSPIVLLREKKEKTLENILAQKEKYLSDMPEETHSNEYRALCYTFLKN